jgi:hypothetical protein
VSALAPEEGTSGTPVVAERFREEDLRPGAYTALLHHPVNRLQVSAVALSRDVIVCATTMMSGSMLFTWIREEGGVWRASAGTDLGARRVVALAVSDGGGVIAVVAGTTDGVVSVRRIESPGAPTTSGIDFRFSFEPYVAIDPATGLVYALGRTRDRPENALYELTAEEMKLLGALGQGEIPAGRPAITACGDGSLSLLVWTKGRRCLRRLELDGSSIAVETGITSRQEVVVAPGGSFTLEGTERGVVVSRWGGEAPDGLAIESLKGAQAAVLCRDGLLVADALGRSMALVDGRQKLRQRSVPSPVGRVVGVWSDRRTECFVAMEGCGPSETELRVAVSRAPFPTSSGRDGALAAATEPRVRALGAVRTIWCGNGGRVGVRFEPGSARAPIVLTSGWEPTNAVGRNSFHTMVVPALRELGFSLGFIEDRYPVAGDLSSLDDYSEAIVALATAHREAAGVIVEGFSMNALKAVKAWAALDDVDVRGLILRYPLLSVSERVRGTNGRQWRAVFGEGARPRGKGGLVRDAGELVEDATHVPEFVEIVRGCGDPRISGREVGEFGTTLRANGVPFRLTETEGGHDTFVRLSDRNAVCARLLESIALLA